MSAIFFPGDDSEHHKPGANARQSRLTKNGQPPAESFYADSELFELIKSKGDAVKALEVLSQATNDITWSRQYSSVQPKEGLIPVSQLKPIINKLKQIVTESEFKAEVPLLFIQKALHDMMQPLDNKNLDHESDFNKVTNAAKTLARAIGMDIESDLRGKLSSLSIKIHMEHGNKEKVHDSAEILLDAIRDDEFARKHRIKGDMFRLTPLKKIEEVLINISQVTEGHPTIDVEESLLGKVLQELSNIDLQSRIPKESKSLAYSPLSLAMGRDVNRRSAIEISNNHPDSLAGVQNIIHDHATKLANALDVNLDKLYPSEQGKGRA